MPLPALIPRPVSLTVQSAPGFVLNAKTVLVAPPEFVGVARRLRQDLSSTGLPLNLAGRGSRNAIRLVLDRKLASEGNEAYRLVATERGVEIRAATPAGAFYGTQTLRQLLPTDVFRRAPVERSWSVPAVTIADRPRFAWRGLHLDVARHYMPREFLFKYVDLMAAHKLNTFHLHLTDDQGWRMEIKKYPKLTSVGAWRKEATDTFYGDQQTDRSLYGGYYSQADLRELVRYAAERFVTVVPEIEMPGHSQAAIAAYPELGNLPDPLGVPTEWGVNVNILNAEESTIRFYKDVLTEVLDVFPSPFIHVGGDEAPKTQWASSPAAQARIKALNLKNEDELQSWFIHQMDAFLTEKGRRLVGWDEILEGGLAPGATVMSWRGEGGGIAAARSGHDVVMTPSATTYLDYYQGEWESEPKAIGGYLPLDRVFAYDPVPASLSPKEAAHVLGVQGQVWTEHISDPRKVEYMAFPRACAISELGWSPREGKSYEDFLNRVRVHADRLRGLDVNFSMTGLRK